MNVAITGISGYLGQRLVKELDESDRIEGVVGIDVADFVYPSSKVEHCRIDIRDSKLKDVFDENDVDVVVHLAFIMNPLPDPALQRDINVNGSKNVLQAAEECGVEKIVFSSSTTVYGAHPDNPDLLKEDSPLRPNIQYAEEKARVERMCKRFAEKNEKAIATILRLCTITGPHIENPYIAYVRALQRNIMFQIDDFPPALQFVHEDDVVRAFYEAIVNNHPDVYNLASDGAANLEFARENGLRVMRFPLRTVKFALDTSRLLKLHHWQPSLLNYAIYRWVASNERIKSEWGFEFKYTTGEALKDAAKSEIKARDILSTMRQFSYFPV